VHQQLGVVDMADVGGARRVELRFPACAQFIHWVRTIYASKPKRWDFQKKQKKIPNQYYRGSPRSTT